MGGDGDSVHCLPCNGFTWSDFYSLLSLAVPKELKAIYKLLILMTLWKPRRYELHARIQHPSLLDRRDSPLSPEHTLPKLEEGGASLTRI